MTDLEMAASLDAILEHEGKRFQPGNVAAGDPCDKFGITSVTLGRWRHLGRDATPAEVSALEETEARAIYRAWYIEGPNFDGLVDPVVRQFVIDYGVNSGVERAAWYLQKAVNVYPDMHVGPVTLAAANAVDPVRLLSRLVKARVNALTRWVRTRPSARGAYVGVIDRAVSFLG